MINPRTDINHPQVEVSTCPELPAPALSLIYTSRCFRSTALLGGWTVVGGIGRDKVVHACTCNRMHASCSETRLARRLDKRPRACCHCHGVRHRASGCASSPCAHWGPHGPGNIYRGSPARTPSQGTPPGFLSTSGCRAIQVSPKQATAPRTAGAGRQTYPCRHHATRTHNYNTHTQNEQICKTKQPLRSAKLIGH